MEHKAVLFFHQFIRFFFLLTPFFALSIFLSMTKDKSNHEKKKIALRVTVSVIIVCLILFLFGNYIFYVFGITIDSFRIGAGMLLFLTAVALVRGDNTEKSDKKSDMTVVPLSIPIIAGPATIGTILVMSTETAGFAQNAVNVSALITAILCVGTILVLSSSIEKFLHKNGIIILSKITGLILSAIASQMVMTGIKNSLR